LYDKRQGENRGKGYSGGSTHEVGRHDLVDGALVGDKGVVEHAGEADHGQAAVLDLRRLVVGEGCGVLAHAKGVKAEVAVAGLAVENLLVGEGLNNANEGKNLCPAGARALIEGLEGVVGEGRELGELGELRVELPQSGV
jgi:hypothetical protein